MERDVPEHKLGRAWEGLERPCSRCGSRFVSEFDLGQCPACGYMCHALSVLGIPEGVDLEAIARAYDQEQAALEEARRRRAIVSPEQSDAYMALLRSPADIDGLDWPKPRREPKSEMARQHLDQIREQWEYEAAFLREVIADGGTLWWWSSSEEGWEHLGGSAGLAVVKDGRVTAIMTTMFN